ncbi:ALDH-like protein [Coccomyxa subellipsoidea C-169]|uniref:ALDH-like protein n=1 Tax=Coccomyxa subellipsoidea (strain C-169) TaxID=574566 RepID=I0Z5F5_COCSC|nr:ALDH-like protein [Coccomyxa subellipsoidea C-169]EIE25874.1 ALDH-like protein [Coccomyxa subellipsoidea C-169]|eukprot:XP_005650418.1 ALDH-like protein [Coccomyxa subellipsoidea C-169]
MQIWKGATFQKRKLFLKTLLKYILQNQEEICRVASIDSGKPLVDAAFGEVMVTCEKIAWLIKEGEKHLRPEHRSSGAMMFYKAARVEYHPVGVVGAIVPWNYPFHNVFNPLTAALFAGNGLVIKVSEHASWSSQYYGRIISAALQAVGAPVDLVQIVTGYAEAGNALVTGGVDKVIFVGSTGVGRAVLSAAAHTLTPVVLELGGKDAFIVCDDADLSQASSYPCSLLTNHLCSLQLRLAVPTALRGAFQSCGQNCAGAERFLVQAPVFDRFVDAAVGVARRLRQGPALGDVPVDCGAMCMPGLADKVAHLVEEAVADGAKVLVGGHLVAHESGGQFYAPTVLVNVTPAMRIWREEVFGPVMVIVRFSDDDEAVRLANDCPFGLGSAVFSRSQRRANDIGRRLQAGMTSINDFATTYMCQSLPFGGVKESGFDRFAGIEGLRGLCVPKAVCEDRFPWLMRTDIPPLLQYPVGDAAFPFVCGLISMFYGLSLRDNLSGLCTVIACFLGVGKKASHKKSK